MNYINTKLNDFNNAIKGKRIAILGIGVSNRPSIEYFLEQNALPVCFDNKDESNMDTDLVDYLKEKNVEYHFGKDNLDYLNKFDYIFRSPSISLSHIISNCTFFFNKRKRNYKSSFSYSFTVIIISPVSVSILHRFPLVLGTLTLPVSLSQSNVFAVFTFPLTSPVDVLILI